MKPAPFKYIAPSSLDEALAVMDEHGFDVAFGGAMLFSGVLHGVVTFVVVVVVMLVAEKLIVRFYHWLG